MSLMDLVNTKFKQLKSVNPDKAARISIMSDGEPFGLYADTDAYRTTKAVTVEFDEDGNIITDIETL